MVGSSFVGDAVGATDTIDTINQCMMYNQICSDVRLPTEWVSPRGPKGASTFKRPRLIFSSLGKGGKNRGGGG